MSVPKKKKKLLLEAATVSRFAALYGSDYVAIEIVLADAGTTDYEVTDEETAESELKQTEVDCILDAFAGLAE